MKTFALLTLLALPALAEQRGTVRTLEAYIYPDERNLVAWTTPAAQLPGIVVQQADLPPAPQSFGEKVLSLFSAGNVATVVSLVLGALGSLAFLTAQRKRRIALAAYYAFHIVEDIGNEIEGDDAFDKTATYLKKLDEYLVANGWRPLKAGETDVAKLQASALHGLEVAKAKVAAAAEAASPQ